MADLDVERVRLLLDHSEWATEADVEPLARWGLAQHERAERAERERDGLRAGGREVADYALDMVAAWADAEQRAQRAEAEAARLREALTDFAEHDCEYGDGCPAFGSRHGVCTGCKARRALDAQPPTPSAIEVRRDESGEVDEIVARASDVHLERMDDDAWQLIVSEPGQPTRGVWVTLYCRDGDSRLVLADLTDDTREQLADRCATGPQAGSRHVWDAGHCVRCGVAR